MNAKIMKLLTIVVGILFSLSATLTFAGGWSGKSTIRKLTVQGDQAVLVFIESGSWKNPDVCDSATKIVLLPPAAEGAAIAYKEFYASLLGAHLTGRDINVFLDGCTLIGNKTFPLISRVAVF